MPVIKLRKTFLSEAELANKAAPVLESPSPEPPADLVSDKHKWIQCTVKNATQFDLLLDGTQLTSGNFWTEPKAVKAFSQMAFSVCKVDHSGINGGVAFKARLDKMTSFPIAIGLTTAKLGGYRAGAVESGEAVAGCDLASREGNAFESIYNYSSRTGDGQKLEISLNVSVTPGQDTTVVIKQVIAASSE